MTYTLSIAETAARLSDIVHWLRAENRVVLVGNNIPVVKLSTLPHTSPQSSTSAMTLREE